MPEPTGAELVERLDKRFEPLLMETCKRGHPWTEENTRWNTVEGGRKRRRCRACANEYQKERKRVRDRKARAKPHFAIDTFRHDVRRFQQRQGLSIHGLAQRAGLSQNALRVWLNGTTKRKSAQAGISLDTAASLALVCDLTLDDYIRGALDYSEAAL